MLLMCVPLRTIPIEHLSTYLLIQNVCPIIKKVVCYSVLKFYMYSGCTSFIRYRLYTHFLPVDHQMRSRNLLSLIQLICCITLVDFQELNQSCISRIYISPLVAVQNHLLCCCFLFYLLMVFESIFVRGVGLFSRDVIACFGVRVVLSSCNELGSIPSSYIFGRVCEGLVLNHIPVFDST